MPGRRFLPDSRVIDSSLWWTVVLAAMAVSIRRGAQYRPTTLIVFIIGIPENGTPNVGHSSRWQERIRTWVSRRAFKEVRSLRQRSLNPKP